MGDGEEGCSDLDTGYSEGVEDGWDGTGGGEESGDRTWLKRDTRRIEIVLVSIVVVEGKAERKIWGV